MTIIRRNVVKRADETIGLAWVRSAGAYVVLAFVATPTGTGCAATVTPSYWLAFEAWRQGWRGML